MGMGTRLQSIASASARLIYVYVNMKLLFVAALLFIGAFTVDALKRCQTNADCEPDGCCYGVGQLLWCHDYSHEGDWCTITSRYGCGCEPGLLCKAKGVWETCQRNITVV